MALQRDDARTLTEYLAEQTGRPESEFEPPEDAEYPHPEDQTWERIEE